MIANANILILFLFYAVFIFILPTTSLADSVNLSLTATKNDENIELSLVVEHAVKIAGMKVTLSYDKKSFILSGVEKSDATSSFLHVVNDKYPGKIILVMASATGISGNKITLCRFRFKRTETTPKSESQISITQLQLMTEDLTEIYGNYPSIKL